MNGFDYEDFGLKAKVLCKLYLEGKKSKEETFSLIMDEYEKEMEKRSS